MRTVIPVIFVLLLGPFVSAQTVDEKAATLKFIASLRDPETGAYAVDPPKEGEKLKPSLRAVNGAVKSIKYLGGEVTDQEKLAKFIMSCYDEKTGSFAEPGGKPDVAMTSIGVMAAAELSIPKEKYRKAMEYLGVNAKTFEEVRIAAAAVEAFGVKECGIDLNPWVRAAEFELNLIPEAQSRTRPHESDGKARAVGSAAALPLRLGLQTPAIKPKSVLEQIRTGQRQDGGWAKRGAEVSDAESTYRVMRCLMLMKEKPNDIDGLKKFLASCRRKDGGYGVDATAPSSLSGTYYFAVVTKWLKEME
jgi:hypothetical protein